MPPLPLTHVAPRPALLQGLFVPQNYTAAKEKFELAAAKDLPAAFNGLGVLAWNGQVRVRPPRPRPRPLQARGACGKVN